MLTPGQSNRIRAEAAVLDRYFPTWSMGNDATQGAFIEIATTTNAGGRYRLRIYVPGDFPNSCPDMVVCEPAVLRGHNGAPLQGASSTMHTLGMRAGFLKICHFDPSLWTPAHSLMKVAMKGRIWLEAYEGHREHGQPIDHWLPHMSQSRLQATAAPSVPSVRSVSEPAPALAAPPTLIGRLGSALGRLFGRG